VHPGQRITLTRFLLKLWFARKHAFSANGSAFTTNSVRRVGDSDTAPRYAVVCSSERRPRRALRGLSGHLGSGFAFPR
jgi:hypothetical protein